MVGTKGEALTTPQEMVIGIECHARPRTLLQGCDCVCLVRLSKVNPGRELGVRESKVQEAAALPRLFFGAAEERMTSALMRKQPAKCSSRQAENLWESIAVAGKSESVLWALLLLA